MRILHVAAMPFPSYQGTQAAIHGMLDALVAAGHDAHLLCYPRGAFELTGHRFAVHRPPDWPGDGSLRSGPSWRKGVLDLRLALRVSALVQSLRPDAVVAHHVEAAASCVLGSARPLVFFAHTALGPELPTYAASMLGPLVSPFLSRAGELVDAALARRADAVAAVSPLLRDMLAQRVRARVCYVPVPWALPPPMERSERRLARHALGIDGQDEVVLYAGNLDGYQGWQDAVAAMRLVALRQPRAMLLVATESDPRPLQRQAVGLCLKLARLDGEPGRRRVHAAADVAVVPRRSPGGVPVKLLDALARGLPVVTTHRAAAGLLVGDCANVTADDDPAALAAGLLRALGSPATARGLARLGREYIRVSHSRDAFLTAFERTLRRDLGPSQ